MTRWIRKRTDSAAPWCAVAQVDDGCATTECGPTLAAVDVVTSASPLPGERCGQCVRVVDARAVAAGLDELRTASMRGIVQLDLSDVDVGDGVE